MENGIVKTKLRVTRKTPVLVRPAEKTFGGLYFLSNLDQTFPYPIEIVFSFKRGSENAVEILKESLAKVLVEFCPFAGCLTRGWDGKLLLRCTGDGVPFVEAASNISIADLGDITRIDVQKLRNFVCCLQDGAEDSVLDIPLLQVQVTKFKCGGITLGITMHHVVTDGKALVDFMSCWAEVAKDMPISVPPFLDRSILFARQPPKVSFPHQEYERRPRAKPCTTEPYVCQSFCFTSKKLDQLKKLGHDKSLAGPPTSFELIMALTWMLQTKAFKYKADDITRLLIAVDIRPKFKPSFPEGYFGNAIGWACAQSKAGQLLRKPLSSVVKMVQDSLKVVSEDHTRSAIDLHEVTRAGLVSENTYYASKWSRLSFYDKDFGWGEPIQVAPASLKDDFMVTVAVGKDSKDINLSLSLPGSVMEIFKELMELELRT